MGPVVAWIWKISFGNLGGEKGFMTPSCTSACIDACGVSALDTFSAVVAAADLEHVFRRSLHHPDDGRLLCLLGHPLQRRLLKVAQRLRLVVDRQPRKLHIVRHHRRRRR